jgi:hypothetical protein
MPDALLSIVTRAAEFFADALRQTMYSFAIAKIPYKGINLTTGDNGG